MAFLDSRNRLARSADLFNQMEAEFIALPDEAKAPTLGQEFDPQTNQITVSVALVPTFPKHWAFLISESLHHLRAALDNLVWELSEWNIKRQGASREPHDRTQYPIATREDRFNDGQIRDVHPDHVALIKRLQPYGQEYIATLPAQARKDPVARERLAHGHPLAQLASLNNNDKHRFLEPVVAANAGFIGVREPLSRDCIVTHVNNLLINEVHAGAPWAILDVIATGPHPEVVMRDSIPPTVSLALHDIRLTIPKAHAFVTRVVDESDALRQRIETRPSATTTPRPRKPRRQKRP